MKNLCIMLCAVLLIMVPACRKKKDVSHHDDSFVRIQEETHSVERVSGPDGWHLTEEDLK